MVQGFEEPNWKQIQQDHAFKRHHTLNAGSGTSKGRSWALKPLCLKVPAFIRSLWDVKPEIMQPKP